jgi:hypothetical protein
MNMITVKPNADDDPEERRVQLWVAVDHPTGIASIDDVYWKVFHPDGTFKVQVHWDDGTTGGVLRQNPSNPSTNNCDSKGSQVETDNSMWEAAWGTGQVSETAIEDESTGLLALCRQGVKAIYWNEFTVSKEQPCGAYRIEAHAVSDANDVFLTNYIWVECFFHLALDFDSVDWGPLSPGDKKVVNGNNIFSPGDGLPTGKNLGNHPMSIAMEYSPLVQHTCAPGTGPGESAPCDPVDVPGAKEIKDFDACFGRSSSQLTCKDPNGAEDQFFWFGLNPSTNLPVEKEILCSNMPGKIDFSVHPPSTLPGGVYIGEVVIWGWAVHFTPCLSPLGLDTDQEHDPAFGIPPASSHPGTVPPKPDNTVPQTPPSPLP